MDTVLVDTICFECDFFQDAHIPIHVSDAIYKFGRM